jgi:hypothetical protein
MAGSEIPMVNAFCIQKMPLEARLNQVEPESLVRQAEQVYPERQADKEDPGGQACLAVGQI